MADFLTRLASRAMGLTPAAEPVVAPMFAPDPLADDPDAAPDTALMQPDHATERATRRPLPGEPPGAPADVPPTAASQRLAAPQPADAPPTHATRQPAAPQPGDPSRPNPSAPMPVTVDAVEDESQRGDDPRLPPPGSPARREQPARLARPAARGTRAERRAQAEAREDLAAGPLLMPLATQEVPSSPARRVQPVAAVTPADADAPSRRDAPAQAAAPPAPPPTIEITIGRVEVRAVAAPPAKPPRPKPAAPGLSLEEYLRGRNEGRAMSNFRAVAAVTATLRQILDDAVGRDVNGASATAVRPNAPAGQLPNPGVNVCLYQVTPNAAWRNSDVPTRSADGGMMQRPRAALDLHYLLSFYGNEAELEPQRVLGSALRVLHDQPILTRKRIRDVIAASPFLAGSNLDEEAELVKFTQLPLSLEELAKVWSVFFQTPYVLSVAFQGGVVLIEGESTPRATLPVRERNLYVVAFRQPVIEHIASVAGAGQPILAGALRITGAALRDEATRVRFGDQTVTPAPDQLSDTQVDVTLPAGLRAGIQSAQVEHLRLMGTPPTLHSGVESNAAPFVLQPTITLAVSNVGPTLENGNPVIVDGVTLQSATLTVTFTPSVGRMQRVKLLLYEFNAPEGRPARTYGFDAPLANGIAAPDQTETASIAFSVQRVFPGAYVARVQVDGAESPLAADANGRYNAPQVTI